jgi:hypothetical protein
MKFARWLYSAAGIYGLLDPIMPAAAIEKISYGVATLALHFRERVSPIVGMFDVVDLTLAALFMLSGYLTRLEDVVHARWAPPAGANTPSVELEHSKRRLS